MNVHMKRWAGLGALMGLAAVAPAVQFTVVVSNLGPQPLSPVFFAATNGGFDIFSSGNAASPALERLAEEGDTSLLVAAAAGAGSSVSAFGTTTGPFLREESRVFTFDTDLSHPWLQWASMLGASNDGFIGSGLGVGDNQINLFQGGSPLNAVFTVSFMDVMDAGTEVNTEMMSDIPAFGNMFVGPTQNGVITSPHNGITGVGDVSPAVYDWYGRDVARIVITSAPVPEPATMGVLGLGIVALLRRRRRK